MAANTDRLTLGLVVNPRTRLPFLATYNETTDRVGIWDARTLKLEGDGYYETDEDSEYFPPAAETGYPRVHTPSGVKNKGVGNGTALYTALCLGAWVEDYGLASLDVGPQSGEGISSGPGASAAAQKWWQAAETHGLATSEEHRQDKEFSDEDFSGQVSTSDMDSILGGDDYDITYIDRLELSGTRLGEEETYYEYPTDAALSNSLIIARFVIEVEAGPRRGLLLEKDAVEEIVDADDTEVAELAAIYALNLSGVAPGVIYLLVSLLEQGNVNPTLMDAFLKRATLGKDPEEGEMFETYDPRRQNPQRRRRRTNPKMADINRSVREIRKTLGWDALVDLP